MKDILIICVILLSVRIASALTDCSEIEKIILNNEAIFSGPCVASRIVSGEKVGTCAYFEKVKNGELNADVWSELLSHYVSESLAGGLSEGQVSWFIQDDEVVELCIASLNCDNIEIKADAIRYLLYNIGKSTRKLYSYEIKHALGEIESGRLSDEMRLFCLCDTDDKEKEPLLKWLNDIPDVDYVFVRALCGEEDAENQLISDFSNSDTYGEILYFAKYLSLVGSEKCAEALIEKLNSDLLRSLPDAYMDRVESIRVRLLRCLGAIYDDEPLFTTDVYKISVYGSRYFDEKWGHDKYVNDVNRWVEKNFGHPAWNDIPVWFKGSVREENGKKKVVSGHLIPFVKVGEGEELPEMELKEEESE